MTLRQFAALRYRRLLEKREGEFMLSQLTAAIYNTGINRSPERPYEPAHFMPDPYPEEPVGPPEPIGDAVVRMLKTAHWAKEMPPEQMRVQ